MRKTPSVQLMESSPEDGLIEYEQGIDRYSILVKGEVLEKNGVRRKIYSMPDGRDVRFYSPIEVGNDIGILDFAISVDNPSNAQVVGKVKTPRFMHTSSITQKDSLLSYDGVRPNAINLVVEANASSILVAAAGLIAEKGGNSQKVKFLIQAAKTIEQGNPNDFAIDVLDTLIALRLYGEEYLNINLSEHDPEIMMLFALLDDGNTIDDGNTTLSDDLNKLMEFYVQQREDTTNKEHARISSALASPEYQDVEPMDPAEICLVHTTSLRPVRNSNGQWTQPTRQSSTGLFYRNTLHTTMNAIVQSHMYGSWDDKDTIIIAPFDKMLSLYPDRFEGMSAIDTAIASEYNESIAFPEGTLVLHGGLLSRQDLLDEQISVDEYKYKRRDFTPEQMQELFGKLSIAEQKNLILSVLNQLIYQDYDYDPNMQKEIDATVNNITSYLSDLPDHILKEIVRGGVGVLAEKIILDSGINTNLEESQKKSISQVHNAIESLLARLNRNRLAEKLMQQQGYPPFIMDQWEGYPASQKDALRYRKLIMSLGQSYCGNHTDSPGDIVGQQSMPHVGGSGILNNSGREDISDRISNNIISRNTLILLPSSSLHVAYMLGLVPLMHRSITYPEKLSDSWLV